MSTAKSMLRRSHRFIVCLNFFAIVTTTPALARAKDLTVYAVGISFEPPVIVAHPGDRITWVNNDGVRHELYFPKNPTDSDAPYLRYLLKRNHRISMTMTKPGDYDYVCRWHGMYGLIHVVKDLR